jgi:solute carrier family 45 protein 1/2/4
VEWIALTPASPYLLELGLSKSYMSLVFMAGPLSGLIVQPLIGIFADRSKSRWGRRRPFMMAGIALCGFAMMLLGWAKEIGGGGSWSIAMAVFAIYLIDFSINAAMSADRALVVDTLPPEKQEEGSAWAGRMFGFGSVAGFFV